MRNSMRIASMLLDWRGSGNSIRKSIFPGEYFLSLCCRHFSFIRPFLTHWCTCTIHQSLRNSMRITTVGLDRRRCGDSSRNTIFCEEVSTSCNSDAVTFRYFDTLWPYLPPVWYINRCFIRWGLQQCVWIGVGPGTCALCRLLLVLI